MRDNPEGGELDPAVDDHRRQVCLLYSWGRHLIRLMPLLSVVRQVIIGSNLTRWPMRFLRCLLFEVLWQINGQLLTLCYRFFPAAKTLKIFHLQNSLDKQKSYRHYTHRRRSELFNSNKQLQKWKKIVILSWKRFSVGVIMMTSLKW